MSFLTTWHRPINTSVEIDDVLDKFFAFPMQRPSGPASNVQTTDIGHQISLVVPGVPKDEIGIDINNNTMTVSYEQKEETANSIAAKSFKKSWALPENADIERVTASADNGIITISIPREETATPPRRTITIK